MELTPDRYRLPTAARATEDRTANRAGVFRGRRWTCCGASLAKARKSNCGKPRARDEIRSVAHERAV